MAYSLSEHDCVSASRGHHLGPPLTANRATIVAVLGEPSAPDSDQLRALADRADAVEVRGDLVGDLDPDWLRQHFAGVLVYALRSAEQGGEFTGDLAERHARLRAAARGYDQIDLEWATDLTADVLAAVPPDRRRLFRRVHRNLAGARGALAALVDEMTVIPAALYVLSVGVDAAEDAVAVVALLHAARRSDLTAMATGPAGLWTRILAPRLGAPVVFAQPDAGSRPGVPTVGQLRTDYGFPELAPVHHLFGIVGRALGRSASPRLHNRAYRLLGLPALYLPFVTSDVERFWRTLIPALDALGLPVHGLTVIAPFKERVLGLVDRPSEAAARCGAANVAWRDGAAWAADTTDTAIVDALAALGVDPEARRTAVVGCGAAGRAVAAALTMAGADVSLVNRGRERGRLATHLLGLPFVPLVDFSPVGFSLIVHATPVTDRIPIPLAGLAGDSVVVELVYTDTTTPLIDEATARGLGTVDGWQVLAAEVALQFQRMTGRTMPPEIAFDLPARLRVGDATNPRPSIREESR